MVFSYFFVVFTFSNRANPECFLLKKINRHSKKGGLAVCDNRWTICNVDDEAREMITEVHETSGDAIGELISQAIREWYKALPFD